jgi:hypothetical protein
VTQAKDSLEIKDWNSFSVFEIIQKNILPNELN